MLTQADLEAFKEDGIPPPPPHAVRSNERMDTFDALAALPFAWPALIGGYIFAAGVVLTLTAFAFLPPPRD